MAVHSWRRVALGVAFGFTVLGERSAQAQQVNPSLVISQVYGGGGNSGAPWQNDFVEIFNRSSSPVSLDGLSIQYTSAAGTGNFGTAGLLTVLSNVTLQPGQYYLVAQAGGANGVPLPTPDQSFTTSMAAGAGKVALVASTTSLGCNGGSNACSAAQRALIVDLVGYGTGGSGANFFEGSAAASTISATLSAQRGDGGCIDTNQNGADFSAVSPLPRNRSSAVHVCGTTVGEVGQCGDAATAINAVQGSGATSQMVGATVNIEGVVVADYQDSTFNGFYVQQADGSTDGNPATSEGIFVFEGSLSVPVGVGNRVRVRGQVAEFSSITELTSVSDVVVCPGTGAVTPTPVTLPVPALSQLERYEGMLVTLPQTLTVSGNFELGRFGSLDLSVNGRLFQPTNIVAPGAAALAQQDLNDRSRLVLDDFNSTQNPNPIPYKDANDTRRTGDTVTNLTGVLEDRFAAWRIQPTGAVPFVNANPRSVVPPSVGGRLRVVGMNTLNFFTSIDTGSDICGPTGGMECRGADSVAEFNRQLAKLLNTIESLSPDIAGLMEIENNASASLQRLVDELNADLGAGTYQYVNTGTIGTDAIKCAFIYKPATVDLVGPHKLLTSAVNPRFIDTKNRPALAQTFREKSSNAKFTVVANHLKSKGSDCNDVGDPDVGDGQGNCNGTRSAAAEALLEWLAGDPTNSGDPDFLLLGDLNAYAKEDPIQILEDGGMTSLIETYGGPSAYSYQFDGQSGYLDHALATATLASQVSGTAEWHSNADEPIVQDYNFEFKTDDPYDGSNAFRSSDHDPLVVGLNLAGPPSPVPAMDFAGVLGAAVLYLFGGAVLVSVNRKRAA